VFAGKKVLLLDMNGTFMFGEDRFGDSEDFSTYYFTIGGTLLKQEINRIIRAVYEFLNVRYGDEIYRDCFPSVESAIRHIFSKGGAEEEQQRIIETFTHHELGYIPGKYAEALHTLKQRFELAAVIDIWSPKVAWLHTFKQAGILTVFSAMSFSSDHGMVKPSPKPFELVLNQLGSPKAEAVVIGDSVRRDLIGAKNVGVDCILVGGTEHANALKSFDNLVELSHSI